MGGSSSPSLRRSRFRRHCRPRPLALSSTGLMLSSAWMPPPEPQATVPKLVPDRPSQEHTRRPRPAHNAAQEAHGDEEPAAVHRDVLPRRAPVNTSADSSFAQ